MTQEEKVILKHTNAIKKFCKGKEIIECVSCGFNRGVRGCAFSETFPAFWGLPKAEETKK